MNLMQSVSKWCNDNQGVLALVSLVVVFIAAAQGWMWAAIAALLLILLFWTSHASNNAAQDTKHALTLKKSHKTSPNKIVKQKKSATRHGTSAKYNPGVIVESVNMQPPYLKKKTESSYVGLRVKWELEYHTLYEEDGGLVRLLLLWDDSYPWVHCTVKLDEYPELKSLPSRAKIIVEGKIDEVDGHTIELSNIKIGFK